MKEQTVYVAADGETFDSRDTCVKYEAMMNDMHTVCFKSKALGDKLGIMYTDATPKEILTSIFGEMTDGEFVNASEFKYCRYRFIVSNDDCYKTFYDLLTRASQKYQAYLLYRVNIKELLERNAGSMLANLESVSGAYFGH